MCPGDSHDSDAPCSSCSTEQCEPKQQETPELERVTRRLSGVKHRILVLSGKGGVGKSTVATNLAISLTRAKKDVGLLDVDIHGPSVPKLLKLERTALVVKGDTILPVDVGRNLKVMSTGFLLPNEDVAVIWRGPRKYGLIQQFLADVKWGALDFLVVDCPPGTGDEPLGIAQMLGRVDGAVIVTTPQDVAITDVRKCVTFCRQLSIPVLGVVENMSGFACPKCGEKIDIFKAGGGERMAEQMGIPLLGKIPIDAEIVRACDNGEPYVQNYSYTEAGESFDSIGRTIVDRLESGETESDKTAAEGKQDGKITFAFPVAEGRLCMHFGHCEVFAIMDADPVTKEISNKRMLEPPPHEPGVLPRWIKEQGATVVIAGGMGARAQQMFAQQGIRVIVGAPSEEPEQIAKLYLEGTLQTGENVCDH